MTGERPDIQLDYPVLDCPDPAALASFYSAVLGWPVTRSEADWYEVSGPGQQRLAFQLAHNFVPVRWPEEGVRNHLDLVVGSLDEGEAWVTGLGASRVSGGVEHPSFRVFRDPSGHHFCLCTRS